MKRGDIYYIEINDEGVTGHEMMKSRPGIIVSRDDHNEAAETVQVVYCSASQHRELPEHVCIRSTPRPSTAMCEHIYTVDKSRLGNFVGHLTPQEMQRLDIGIMVALDIGGGSRVRGKYDGSTLKSLNNGGLKRSELQRTARHVLSFLLKVQSVRDKIEK